MIKKIKYYSKGYKMRNSKNFKKLNLRRANRPGYYLGSDKIGRKSWRAFNRFEKKKHGDIKAGDIVNLDKDNNGVVEGVGDNVVILKNYKNNKKSILYGHEEYDVVPSPDSSNKIKSGSDDKSRISGTGMNLREVLNNYDSLPYKIGQVVENKNNREFEVVASSKEKAILFNKSGVLFAVPQSIKKLKTLKKPEMVKASSLLGESVKEYSKHIKNKITYDSKKDGRDEIGIVAFIKDLKSMLSIVTGIYDNPTKKVSEFSTLRPLRGKYL